MSGKLAFHCPFYKFNLDMLDIVIIFIVYSYSFDGIT